MTPAEKIMLFTDIRSWLELLYFISGIVVMFLIGFGLRQLQLAKEQLTTTKEMFRTQSKRAAMEAAVTECRRFSETIIQDSLAIDKYCKENSITYFEDAKFVKTDGGFTVDAKDVKKDDIEKLSNAEDLLNRFVNGLEAFALFFLSGVADENIAFHANAKSYIQLAETAFKLFPMFNVEEDDAEPIKDLYFMWHKKYEAKKLKIKQKEIASKLATYSEKNIKAIGT